jgi:hypothetical protein
MPPVRTGGDIPDPINTETEYAGKVPMPNSVGDLGPNVRGLEPHEKMRLGYLTGQEEDPLAPAKDGFMGGVDPDFPDFPELEDFIPADYRSEDYLS